MKIIFGILLLAIGCYTGEGYGQLKKGFSIEGRLVGLKDGTKLSLLIHRGGKQDVILQTIAKKDSFKFNNVVLPVYPEFYHIAIDPDVVDEVKLFLSQEGDVKVSGTLKEWPKVIITGSKSNDEYRRAEMIRRKVWDEDFSKKFPDKIASIDTILLYSIQGVNAVINQMPDSYYIPAMLATWTYVGGEMVPADHKKPLYDKLSEKHKQSHYGKILARQIGVE